MRTETPQITIPHDLRPRDGRFASGPSKVRPEALRALAETGAGYLGTSHRKDRVKSVVRELREGLRELFALPEGYEVLLGLGGASLVWDAAAAGLIERRSRHAVFGEFSRKFVRSVDAAPHLEPPEIDESDPGTHPEVQASDDVDVYALTHNETSTGVMMPVRRPATDGIVVVDGTSAAGGLRIDPAEFDLYYFSPQKAFAADAGLWFALCSPAALERIERLAEADRWIPPILSLQTAVENSRKDQTLNTPPLATLFLMRETLRWMLDGGGLGWAASRSDRNAEALYDWAAASDYATPFVTDPEKRSHVVGTVDLSDDVDGDTVAAVLRANGILDTEPYRKLGRNQLRVALFPAIEADDVERLTRCVDHVVEVLS